jgi:Spy/CpxP family protein refolding chaperone
MPMVFARGVLGILAIAAGAQDRPPPGAPGETGYRMHEPQNGRRPPSRGPQQPPPGQAGKWWNNRSLMRRLGLTANQQKQIDLILQQSRLRLIDLRAALEKQELILGPLLAEDHPKEASVLPQIERIAAARAQLEEANARMLFEIRLVLTTDQWKELQLEDGTHPETHQEDRPPPRLP